MAVEKTFKGVRGRKSTRVGRLSGQDEKLARAIANPANFGEIVLGFEFYKKQRKALEICMGPPEYGETLEVSIVACNGAGKTARLIPTLVLWHQSLFPGGVTKVTSGSYTQIEDQIWPAIREHKDKFPGFKWYETPYFVSRDPHTYLEGFFRGFTTNEPGKAEGQHEQGPDRPLMFIGDEAKSLPLWMRGVISGRVRPTRLILMSSHGFSEGWFYESQTILAERGVKANIIEAD